MIQAEQIRTESKAAAKGGLALARDFAWLLAGALLLGLLIGLGEYAALPPALDIPLGILRLLLGLAYILYAPGYCLTAALFPADEDLDGIERTGLSLGLGVAWVSILALILDRLPWGLQLWPIFLGELISMILFMVIALWRRARQPAGLAYAPEMEWRPGPWWASLPQLDKRVYLLCAAALLVAGLAVAYVFLVPSDDEFMTEFYILGKEGLAEDYPRQAEVGQALSVTLGLNNLERETKTYNVEVWAVDPWEDRRELIQTAGPFTLDREESVEQPLAWAMPWAGDDQIIEFYLYTTDQEGQDPYRALRLWLDVLPDVDQDLERPQAVEEPEEKGDLQIVPYGDG